ncbi:hypothetical protein [Mesorhizobium sp. M0030]|uniref:hypothetical protein n=1 Tax=Mesorhizobium sp. M0030 TaxID=2956851 RepID=UPI003337E1F8
MTTTPADPLVSGLIADAKLVANYGRYGVFKDSSLFAAIGNAEKLDDATASQPEVVNLQTVFNDCSGTVPFATLAALRSGWSPGDMSRKTALATYFLVALSVLFMVVTGRLTYIYNKGVAINSELIEIDNNDFSARFGQAIRQVWATKKQLSSASSEQASTTDLTLLKDAYYNSEDSLHALDQRFSSLVRRAQGFMTEDAQFPIWGMQWMYCKLYSTSTADGVAAGQAQYSQQGAIDQFCDQPLGVSKSTPPDKLKELPNQPDAYCAQINTEKKNPNNLEGTSSEKVTDVNADFDEATRSLQCDGVITIAPNSIYTLTAQIKTLDEVLSPYALWILPAFYGALGAIMFHMRMILNPLLPNPPLSRLIHRIALGALAGMVLAWFVAPGTKLGEEASGIGFSLFTFSFLFGFSLDIFFTILDQFVSMSVAGIKKFGSSTVA